MISFYTTFRRFDHNRFDKIQRDAIESWQKLVPQPEIIVIGNDIGVTDICQEYDLIHIPEVRLSEAGTPYLNDLIHKAEETASFDIMLLCAGDVLIYQDTIDAAQAVSEQLDEFCVCTRKMHVQVENGEIQPKRWATWQAGDYYLHTKGIFAEMPDFLIGRHRCEKWQYRLLCNKNALVDGTEAITLHHQQHPHEFKPENKELEWNRKMYDEHYFDVDKWKDTVWYKKTNLLDIGINFANWKLTKELKIVTNEDPRREDWYG